MKRTRTILWTFAFLAMASTAWAGGKCSNPGTGGSVSTGTSVTAGTSVSTGTSIGTTATTATTVTTVRTGTDVKIDNAVNVISSDATRMGDATFADRLGAQFGVSADVLAQQRSQFNATWGDLAVAHSIATTSRTGVTVDQIFGMRADGRSWTQIARTLRVPPGRLMTSVRTQVETFDTAARAGVSGRSAARTRIASRTEGRLESRLGAFEAEAARVGDQAMAQRLSAQFGVSSTTLLAQKAQLGATWSDLLVAYTVAARTRSSVTINQIVSMRASGRTWSEIASSLRLPGGRLLTGVGMETRALFSTKASATGAARLRERNAISVSGGKILRTGWKGSVRSDAVMRDAAHLTTTARAQTMATSGARNTMLTRASTSSALRTNPALRTSMGLQTNTALQASAAMRASAARQASAAMRMNAALRANVAIRTSAALSASQAAMLRANAAGGIR